MIYFVKVFFLVISFVFTIPTISKANEGKAAFQALADCERKFVQNFLKADNYYKSSIDGLWGKGTDQAIIKFANGRPIASIIKELGICLPRGATIFNAYGMRAKGQKVQTVYNFVANQGFPTELSKCFNEVVSSGRKFNSFAQLVDGIEPCLRDLGYIRVDYKMYDKFLEKTGDLRKGR